MLLALLGQLPTIAVGVLGAVVAALVIRGPARWLAASGAAAGIVGSALWFVLAIAGSGDLLAPAIVVRALLGLVSWALLGAAVIVAHRWGQRQASGPPASWTYGPYHPGRQVPGGPGSPQQVPGGPGYPRQAPPSPRQAPPPN